MRTIGMSDYTVGEDCFDELPGALAEYGAKKVAIIGGKRALAAAFNLDCIHARHRLPSNNSFKPSPLRGLGAIRFALGGPA